MAAYLTEAAVFSGEPAVWLDWQTGAWMHCGHVSESVVSEYLAAWTDLDELVAVPGSARHEWRRFTVDATADDGDRDLRWETVPAAAEGALPVTVVTATSAVDF